MEARLEAEGEAVHEPRQEDRPGVLHAGAVDDEEDHRERRDELEADDGHRRARVERGRGLGELLADDVEACELVDGEEDVGRRAEEEEDLKQAVDDDEAGVVEQGRVLGREPDGEVGGRVEVGGERVVER